jgi:protein arginine kinase activator
MKCSFCKSNDAIIHVHEYTSNGIKKINLCLNCAIKNGLNVSSVQELDKLFNNLVKNLAGADNGITQSAEKITNTNHKITLSCPSCKTTIIDINENIKLGCPICYSMFEHVIDLVVFKINGSLDYLGKLPIKLGKIKDDKAVLNKLKLELKGCLKSEEYEKAALIRDKIKMIKKTIQKRISKNA